MSALVKRLNEHEDFFTKQLLYPMVKRKFDTIHYGAKRRFETAQKNNEKTNKLQELQKLLATAKDWRETDFVDTDCTTFQDKTRKRFGDEYNPDHVRDLICDIYIKVASSLWDNIYLYTDKCSDPKKEENQKRIKKILLDCIKGGVRDFTPQNEHDTQPLEQSEEATTNVEEGQLTNITEDVEVDEQNAETEPVTDFLGPLDLGLNDEPEPEHQENNDNGKEEEPEEIPFLPESAELLKVDDIKQESDPGSDTTSTSSSSTTSEYTSTTTASSTNSETEDDIIEIDMNGGDESNVNEEPKRRKSKHKSKATRTSEVPFKSKENVLNMLANAQEIIANEESGYTQDQVLDFLRFKKFVEMSQSSKVENFEELLKNALEKNGLTAKPPPKRAPRQRKKPTPEIPEDEGFSMFDKPLTQKPSRVRKTRKS